MSCPFVIPILYNRRWAILDWEKEHVSYGPGIIFWLGHLIKFLHLYLVWDGRVPFTQPVKPLIAIRDKKEHTRRRRPWTRAFSTDALKGYEEIVIKRSSQLVNLVLAQKSVVNLSDFTSFFG